MRKRDAATSKPLYNKAAPSACQHDWDARWIVGIRFRRCQACEMVQRRYYGPGWETMPEKFKTGTWLEWIAIWDTLIPVAEEDMEILTEKRLQILLAEERKRGLAWIEAKRVERKTCSPLEEQHA